MRWLLALLLLLLPSLVRAANIRALCDTPPPFTFPAICLAQYPGQYAGGDTINLWNLNAQRFELTANYKIIDIKPDSLGPVFVDETVPYWWTTYHQWTEIATPSAPGSPRVVTYAKAGNGFCSRDSSGAERCMVSAATRTATLCTHLASLASGTASFIAPIANAGTLVKAWCITTGTITTAPTIHIAECASDGTTCSDNTTSALTCDANGDSTTTFGGAAGSGVDTDDWLQANITNVPSVTAGVTTLCASYQPN